MDAPDLIPERRAKSWKREHEERCRRHQNYNDPKKFRDSGNGSDQSSMFEIKDNSESLTEELEKMDISMDSGDFNEVSDNYIVDVENEDPHSPSAEEIEKNSDTEKKNMLNRETLDGDASNKLVSDDQILCDGSTNEISFNSKVKSDITIELGFEQRAVTNCTEINGVSVDSKRESTKLSLIDDGNYFLCNNVKDEFDKLPYLPQEVETNVTEDTPQDYNISEIKEPAPEEGKQGSFVISGEESEDRNCKETSLGYLMENLSETKQVSESLSTEEKQLVPAEIPDVKLIISEISEVGNSKFKNIVNNFPPEGNMSDISSSQEVMLSDWSELGGGLSDSFLKDLESVPLGCVLNSEETLCGLDVSDDALGNGETSEDSLFRDEFSTYSLPIADLKGLCTNSESDSIEYSVGKIPLLEGADFDLLDNVQYMHCVENSTSELNNDETSQKECDVAGSLNSNMSHYGECNGAVSDGVCIPDVILSPPEIAQEVDKKLSESGIVNIDRRKNSHTELKSHKGGTRIRENVEKSEPSNRALNSSDSTSPHRKGKQNSEASGTSETNKFSSERSFRNAATKHKTEQKATDEKYKNTENGMCTNSTKKISDNSSKFSKDCAAAETISDALPKNVQLEETSNKYCHAVDSITLSENDHLHPSALTSEDKKILDQYVTEIEQRLVQKQILRQENQDVASLRPDESHFSRLDSSLKKNTAFVRKLKTFTCSQLDSLLKDMSSLNLTKYISEAASAIVEAKLKMTDVMAAVELCNSLHHMYTEFSSHLLENWHRFLSIKKDDRAINQSKLRVDLRFYAELINVGIFTHKEGLPLLGNVLTVLVNMDREEHNNVNIILSFCRHCGEEYAGLVPRKIRLLAAEYQVTLPRSKLLTKEKQRNVKTLLKDYYGSLMKHVMKEHRELQAFERQNKKILQTRGELSGERKEKWENLKYSYERLLNGMTTFAEILDEDVPVLPEDGMIPQYMKDEDMRMIGTSDGEETGFTSTIWEDEEEQRFYEYLTDMKEFLPSISVRPPEPVSEISEEVLDAEAEELDEEPVIEGKDDEEEPSPPEPDDIEELESVTNSSNKILMESFLTHLPHCVNREMIDSSAVEFVMSLNTKYNRKKLVKMLFSVPRTRLDLLPFYARFVATLHPVVPDVSMELGQFLKQDFKFHVRKKDQINIESKIKVVRFIGELVKFRMYSKIEALYCLKLLLHDFTHHHIEMCCSLLESCGRFLFRNPDSHQRTKVYLEQMMRKKSVTALDSRYVTMIENAFYYVDPPDTAPFVKKERPPMHEFIRKILYQDLMKANTDKVLRLMRKLEWEDPDLAEYAVKCLTMAHNVKYYNIRCLASLLAGLVTHQEMVGTHVVDGVMEDIRLGMEVNLPKYSQRRVAMIKYLGELYNYRMVESSDIFKVLYSLISFGISLNLSSPSFLDPPEHLFRIRLVCVLLETCGQYFNNGISKLKLDYYFTYFQRYFWFKYEDKCWTTESPFPVGIHYLFKDTLTSLRPKLHLFPNYEEANQGVRQMQLDLAPMLSDHMPWLYGVGTSDAEYIPPALGADLGTIAEAASEGDDDACTESEIADVTDAETETEESLSHDGRPVKKSVKSVEGEEGECGDEEEDEEYCEALSEFEDGEGEQEWGGTSSSPLQQSQGDDASMVAALPQGPTHVECPEDEDFLSAFDRMVSDNIQDRMRETVKPQQVDISVPLHIKSSAKKTYEQLQETRVEEKSTMNFVLMVRKGHKQQYKSLAVPINSELALNLKNREEAERAEKERVKRLTLDINERLEEEDYQEMLAQAQRPVVMNLNRERKHKYQHPKGAPDADLIFGPKKVR